MFDRHRRRRVIYNDDGDQMYQAGQESYGYRITDLDSLLATRTTPVFGSQVDTYVWCLGNGADPPWGGGEFELLECFESPGQVHDAIVTACHDAGLEVWGSLRMNDIHDSFMAATLEQTHDLEKARHPEWMIGSVEQRDALPRSVSDRHLWSAFDFREPGVRAHRLAFLEATARAHDFDGYELDFTRFVWNFPLGHEGDHAHHMTALVRESRRRLDAIGRARGRPYTFVAHVFDSPRTSLDLGLDVERWLAEGLVDVLTVGMGYMPYVLRLDEWVALGRRHGVPIYPSVNTNAYAGPWRRLHGRPVFHEALRAAADWYWQAGADGQYVFNLFCQQDRNVAGLDSGYIYAPLHDIGDPTALRGLDKIYCVPSTDERGFCQQGSEAAPLPIALTASEHVVALMLGADAADTGARIRVRAHVASGDAGQVWMRLNNRLLGTGAAGDWAEAEVPPGLLRPGENRLALWREEEGDAPVVVDRVFVPVTCQR